MKEEEAKKKCQELIETRKDILCPLFRGSCTTSCECFIMPTVINIHPEKRNDTYFLEGGYCSAYALKGVI